MSLRNFKILKFDPWGVKKLQNFSGFCVINMFTENASSDPYETWQAVFLCLRVDARLYRILKFQKLTPGGTKKILSPFCCLAHLHVHLQQRGIT